MTKSVKPEKQFSTAESMLALIEDVNAKVDAVTTRKMVRITKLKVFSHTPSGVLNVFGRRRASKSQVPLEKMRERAQRGRN